MAVNPYLPEWEYVPDGEPHVFDGRVYVFGSHDRFGGESFCELDYVCWSADEHDLGDWRFEGEIYKKERDPKSRPSSRLFAPDVCRGPDGRYYLYYALDFQGVIGVAVSGRPGGRYEFLGNVRWPDGTELGRRPGDPFQFDPAVMNDGGRIYLYSGMCRPTPPRTGSRPEGVVFGPDRGPMGVMLEPDMLTVRGDVQFIAPCYANSAGTGYEGHEFFEAPSVRRVGERYYFIYSSLRGHELCWAVGDEPLGRFSYGGVAVSNGDIGLEGRDAAVNYTGNNHGSIVEIGGAWYVFYHRQTNRHQFSRQGCAERIEFTPDGRIKQAEITSQGLNGGPLPARGVYGAYIACNLMGPGGATEYPLYGGVGEEHPYLTMEGGRQYIANMRRGSVAGFKYFEFKSCRGVGITIRGRGEVTVTVALSDSGEPAAEVRAELSGQWREYEAGGAFPDGVRPVFLQINGTGSADILEISWKY